LLIGGQYEVAIDDHMHWKSWPNCQEIGPQATTITNVPMSHQQSSVEPRGLSKADAAAYCGCESLSAFDAWVRRAALYRVQSQEPTGGTGKPSMKPLTEHPVSGPQSWLRHSSSGRRAVRVELKGIHRVSRRLAKGKRVHYYAWRGGPKITAEPGTPEFIEQYNEAHRSRRKPDRSTFSTLIAEFKASGEQGNRVKEITQRRGWRDSRRPTLQFSA
jgi:hypothetical protein